MYRITNAKKLCDSVFLFEVKAQRIAQHCMPGQFVIVRSDENGERIPLTICDYSARNSTISICFQVVGEGTLKLSKMKKGEYLHDVVGPLGCASEFCCADINELRQKRILFVAGGLGAAPIYPQVKWLKENGVDCDVIIGAKTKELIIFENEIKACAKNVYITTDDGSYGKKGLVTNVIEDLINNENKQYDLCIAIGPMIMMKFVCITTKALSIPTIVSLNPIMVDGTGMCGACRVTVDGKIKFACVDGPEFDGHKVDFDEAMKRQQIYKTEQGRAYLKEKEGDTHHGGCGHCEGDN